MVSLKNQIFNINAKKIGTGTSQVSACAGKVRTGVLHQPDYASTLVVMA